MISSTYSGQNIFILPYQPNWEEKVSASFQKMTKVETGLGNREEREELALKLRAELTYTALLDTAEAAQLRAAIAIWDNRPILCPFWPSETLLTPAMPPTGSLLDDSSGSDLVDSSGSDLEDSGNAGTVEVATTGLVPGPGNPIDDSSGSDLEDSSGAELDDAGTTFVPGIILTPVPIPILSSAPYGPVTPAVGGGLNIFYEPDWSNYEINTASAPVTFTPTVNCLVSPVLWGRFTSKLPEQIVVTGSDWEAVTFELTENGSAAFSLDPSSITLPFGANVNGFTVPQITVPFTWGDNKQQGDVRIKRDKVGYGRSDADEFYPQTPRCLNTLMFQAMNAAELTQILHVFRVSAGSVWPLWIQPANTASGAPVYGRFFTEKITVDWDLPARAGELASSTVEFVTLPTEQTVPIGEVFAETIGPKPPKWFGYQVTDGVNTWLYTSYESAIAGPGGTFNPTPFGINHGTIDDEINLKLNDCTLTVQYFAGMPFLRLRNNLNAAQLTVTIYEGYTTDPTAAQMIYTGYCIAPKITGQKWEIKLRGLGSKLDIKGPRLLLQPTCNAAFCDSRCTLSVASQEITKTLNYVSALGTSGQVVSFGSNTDGATWANKFNGSFATGQAIRSITQYGVTTTQNYLIHDAMALTDGTLGIVLASPVQPPPTGAETGWVLVPGCDGQFSTCTAYGNTINFRGMPYLPAQDPSIPPTTTPTGKKG